MQNPFVLEEADVTPARARLNGQRFLLTYSQVGDNAAFNIISLGDFLYSIEAFHWAEIAEEVHADGEPHMHCVVVFRRRLQKHMGAFDFLGKHPNIKPIRNGGLDLFRARHYIRKGVNEPHSPTDHEEACCYTYEPYSFGTVPRYLVPQPRLSWGEILDGATDLEDFLRGIRQHYPRDYILRFENVLTFGQQHFSRPYDYVPQRQPEEFRVPDELDEWVESVLRQVRRTRSPGSSIESKV